MYGFSRILCFSFDWMLFVGRLFGANFLESNEKYNSKNETDLMKCLRGKGISLFQLLSEHEKKMKKRKNSS